MFIQALEIFCVIVFALSAVISRFHRGKDIVSITIVGWITALGGGTIRDIILSTQQVFWIRDPSYFWAAFISSFIGFFLAPYLRRANAERIIVFLDAVGISIFSVLVTKELTAQHYSTYVSITMGMITAVFGGVLRDILINRPTMFNNTELYATPVIIGSYLYVFQIQHHINSDVATLTSIFSIVIFRMYIIVNKISFPKILILK